MTEKKNKWTQQLLMSVFGTTISIILTFGTNTLLDSRKKKAQGRQTAMMVIHDIDNTAQTFRDKATAEEEDFKKSQYVLNHLDSLKFIGSDTLNVVFTSIIKEHSGSYFDDSSEKVFLSSQDSWKYIDNATFIDVVQEFYQSRRVSYEYINTGMVWEKPVDEDHYRRREMTSTQYQVDMAEYLGELLRQDRVKYYINSSPARQRVYNQFAEEYSMTSNRCKFLMGITDGEMQKYIESRQRPGKRVKDKNLLGKWVLMSNADVYQGFVFDENHRFKTLLTQHYMDPFFTGRLELEYVFTGTWEIQGDSLITVSHPYYDYKIDDSGIEYKPEKKKYVEDLLASWEAQLKAARDESIDSGDQRKAYYIALDPSGDRIEMTVNNVENGVEKQDVVYISRE